MRKRKLIATLLTGTLLCSSIPMNAWGSDLDTVFNDGETVTEDVPSPAEDMINSDRQDVNETTTDNSDMPESDGQITDLFTDENEFEDGTEVEFSDPVNAETEVASAEASDAVYDAVWNGHYYKVYDSSMKWDDAKKFCQKQGGHLVTINSPEEQEKICSLISHGNKNFYWLGAERIQNNFNKWITGEPIKYTNYDISNNEPNNFTGKENALVIYRVRNPMGGYDGQYKWNDLQKDGDCNGEDFFGYQNSGFICEWNNGQGGNTSTYDPKIYNAVQKLLKNTNESHYPLLEYDDPVKLAAGFGNTPSGALQVFIKMYGDIKSNDTLCKEEYEEVLINLLAKDSVKKAIIDIWDDDLNDIVSGLELDVISDAADVLNISIGSLTDMVRNDIKYDIGKILVLSSIADSTADNNLKKACQICMSDSFNSTFKKLKDFLVKKAVDAGKDFVTANQMVQNQILSTSLKKGFLNTIIQKCSLGTVSSMVSGILFVKDVVSFATGINKRVDNYMKTVSLNFIYSATAEAYGKKVTAIKAGDPTAASDAYILFQFLLNTKQMAYKNMQGMFTSSTWNKIIKSDPYLKKNTSKIQKLTINNYVKSKLGYLNPKVKTSKMTLNVKDKKNFPATGISYLSNIKYSSANKKIAQISSSGVIQAKKAGTTYIKCKIEQYGNTYNLKCRVTVK